MCFTKSKAKRQISAVGPESVIIPWALLLYVHEWLWLSIWMICWTWGAPASAGSFSGDNVCRMWVGSLNLEAQVTTSLKNRRAFWHPKMGMAEIEFLFCISPRFHWSHLNVNSPNMQECNVWKLLCTEDATRTGHWFSCFSEVFALSLGPGQRLTSAWKRAGTAGRHCLSLELSSLHSLSWLIPDLNLCLQKSLLIQLPKYQMERCEKSVCFQKASFPFPFWAWQNISSFCCRKYEFTA